MAEARVTAEHVDAVVEEPTGARTTAEYVDLVVEHPTGVRVTAEHVDVVVRSVGAARISSADVEAVVESVKGARVAAVGVEAVIVNDTGARISAASVEVVVSALLELGEATSSITFGATGSIGVVVPLAGTSAVTFGATGTMALQIALAGQSALVTSTQADLAITPGWALSGSSGWIFGASGTLTFVPTLAGQVDVDLALGGNLTEIAPLAGQLDVDLDLDIQPLPLHVDPIDIDIEISGSLVTFAAPAPIRPRVGFLHINPRILPQPGDYETVPDSTIPLPAPDDPNIYVGWGDQTLGVDSLDEFAYVTSADGRYLYLIGGYWWGSVDNGPSWAQWWSNRTYRWDAEDLVWTELEPLPGYTGAEGNCAGRIDNKIYVLLGDSGDSDVEPFGAAGVTPDPEWLPDDSQLQSMWIYDIPGDSWTRGTQPPFAQDYGGCVAFDGKLYVVVGYDIDGQSDAAWSYDPTLDTWTELASLPDFPRGTPPNVWVGDDKIWVASTFGLDAWPGDNMIFSYDPALDTWTDETALFTGLPTTTPSWPYGVRFYASAVMPISSTVVRIAGNAGYGAENYDINVVTKTIVRSSHDLPDAWGWTGGTYYNGSTFVVIGEPSHVVVRWSE